MTSAETDTLTVALGELDGRLGPGGLLTRDDDLVRYETGPNRRSGRAAFVARPATVDEVVEVLDWAFRHRIRLVPQGANSGLVAAAIPDQSGECGVLSTERLRERFDVDLTSRTLTVSAGWQLDEINDRLREHGLQLPVELGSSPSVGGMIGSNTAGAHVIKYGDVRHRTLGLRAVLANGARTVVDALRPLRKCNEGLDVKQLFIGTAGAFGVVTDAVFELAPLPGSKATAWLAVPEPHVLDVLTTLERLCAGALSAYEVFSPVAMRLLLDRHPELATRIPTHDTEFFVLAEISAPGGDADALLADGLEAVALLGKMNDARVGPPAHMWEVRHTLPLITQQMDPVLTVDLSVTRSALLACRTAVFEQLAKRYPEIEPIDLGHYADGGFHLVMPLPESLAADTRAVNALRDFVYDIVVRDHGGSFSAEHGIGPKNYAAYQRYVPENVRAVAGALKSHFDPHNVLGSISLR